MNNITSNIFLFGLVALVLGFNADSVEGQEPYPNILWISCEDITTMLGCYGDPNASTPHLDAFASKAVRFSHAFATAPVCSPSRSCLITGNYATTLGTQHLRSVKEIPGFIVPFPKYLREAGYYTTNNHKEDYNFIDTSIWDESSGKAHWRNRADDGQPFFSVFNFEISHQSGIFGNDSVYAARIKRFLPFIKPTDPKTIQLPPYFPDSPGIRKLWARYYTNVSIVDYQFSNLMQELNEDGLSDNTIVFFFSDHGTGMPRSKRALFDSGLKIPLIVSVPEKWQMTYNMQPGMVNNRMVSFVDFPPTVLEIVGVEVPEYFQGKAFISKRPLAEKKFVFGTSDRVDEAYEMSRTIRTQKYQYIRNFMPHLPLLQPNFYSDQSEIMQALHQVDKSKLTGAQKSLFSSSRMPEELYDTEEDPYEVKNLAADPDYREMLVEMRDQCQKEMIDSYDTGLMPEPEMIRLAGNTPYHLTHNQDEFPIETILSACNLILNEDVSLETWMQYLNHPNGFVRYWTLITIQAAGVSDEKINQRLEEMLNDEFPTVQIESAKVLVEQGDREAVVILNKHLKNVDYIALYAARTYELLAPDLKNVSKEFMDIYRVLEKETDSGSLSTENYYKLYTFWALSETLAALQ